MLIVRRPTPTTALYTVSTASQARTLTAQSAKYLLISLRCVVGLYVLVACAEEFCSLKSRSACINAFASLEKSVVVPIFQHLAQQLSRTVHPAARFAIYAALSWIVLRRGYVEESLLVIRGLGVQTSTSSSNYLMTSSTRFIPTSSIQDILIHEAFKGFEVRYYMAIVVEGEGELVVVFPKLLPRRETLERVWRGAKACLYEPKS